MASCIMVHTLGFEFSCLSVWCAFVLHFFLLKRLYFLHITPYIFKGGMPCKILGAFLHFSLSFLTCRVKLSVLTVELSSFGIKFTPCWSAQCSVNLNHIFFRELCLSEHAVRIWQHERGTKCTDVSIICTRFQSEASILVSLHIRLSVNVRVAYKCVYREFVLVYPTKRTLHSDFFCQWHWLRTLLNHYSRKYFSKEKAFIFFARKTKVLEWQ